MIDPGRAFGTGGHPTTQLCLQLLEGEERGSVLDVGCGSGVLSIAAAKLGFAPVRAFDFDPQAVEATERNAADNGVAVESSRPICARTTCPLPISRSRTSPPRRSSQLGPRLRAARAITSGYLVSDEPELEGYRRERRVQSGGWAADLHVRQ